MSTTTAAGAVPHNGWHDGAGNKGSPYTAAMSFVGRPISPFSPRGASRGPSKNEPQTPLQQNGSGRLPGIRNPDLLSPQRTRVSSVHSKGKHHERRVGDASSNAYDPDHYPSPLNASSTTLSTFEHTLRAAHPDMSTLPKRSRNSFFNAASDALNLRKFNKKKNAVPLPSTAVFLPEVIAITSTRRESVIEDTEEEERERLRDAAAQSIGLDPEIMTEKTSRLEPESDEETGEENGESASLFASRGGEEDLASSLRIEQGPFVSPLGDLHRPGSIVHSVHHSRNRSYSTPMPTVPMFPTTVSSLMQFAHISAVLPKYYPSPSLLKFSLSKQWKNRYIIMTSPTQVATAYSPRPTSAPTASYLHLFKSHSSFEKEIERLEINEDSVVFVNEYNEGIAGRRNVLRVGGVDCGAMKKVLNLEENGRTMWLLQVTDAQELQMWITAVKNSVLGQRSVRAGLGLPAHSLGGTEPRGDLDVMLSIRAQGIMSSPTKNGFDFARARGLSVTSQPSIGHDQSISSSSHSVQSTSNSLRSQTNSSPMKSSTTAVSAFKGLFTGSSRPRSPSLCVSSGSEDGEKIDESFRVFGNNLLTMLQAPNERSMSPLASSVVSTPPVSPTQPQLEPQLERKIVQDPLPIDHWVPFRQIQPSSGDSVLPFRVDHPFIGSSALQPPPRKRPATAYGSTSTPLDSGSYKYIHANSSTAESFGVGQTAGSLQSSPTFATTPLGVTERKPRVPSWSSTSSFASGASGSSGSGSKRWSRQGAIPRMLTPPSGSPPPVPPTSTDGVSTPRMQSPHPYAMDRSSSRSSSSNSHMSPQSVVSNNMFSKRASGSSFQTVSTVSSHTWAATGNNRASNRLSIPPPQRPAPNTALPPTPIGDNTKPPSPSPSAKLKFRDSFAHRALRLSLAGPPSKTPPSSVLPPRPDEVSFASHRRSSSSSSIPRHLYPIPASPHPSDLPGRLPTPPPQASIDANRQHTSIKQRLRMLSAPSSISTTSPQPSPTTRSFAMDRSFIPSSPDSADDSVSSGHFVIGEPITTMQNDPSFLLMRTPVVSPPTPPLWSPTQDSAESTTVSSPEMPEMASLSPPPWRAMRRSYILDGETKDGDESGDYDSSLNADGIPTISPPSLSSAISIANFSP